MRGGGKKGGNLTEKEWVASLEKGEESVTSYALLEPRRKKVMS